MFLGLQIQGSDYPSRVQSSDCSIKLNVYRDVSGAGACVEVRVGGGDWVRTQAERNALRQKEPKQEQ